MTEQREAAADRPAVEAARRAADATRRACIEAAVRAYQDAAVSGLCGEGALEAAVSAMRLIDVDALAEGHAGREGAAADSAAAHQVRTRPVSR